jgi:two-component system cell cycle response regulator
MPESFQKLPAKRILVVDDDMATARLIRDVLTSYGFDVRTSGSATMMQASRDHLPDLLLIDPPKLGESGVEAVQELRLSTETASIPVVLISASPDVEQWAAQANAASYLRKPCTLFELLAAVEAILEPDAVPAPTDAPAIQGYTG